jgi:hypothetical protein
MQDRFVLGSLSQLILVGQNTTDFLRFSDLARASNVRLLPLRVATSSRAADVRCPSHPSWRSDECGVTMSVAMEVGDLMRYFVGPLTKSKPIREVIALLVPIAIAIIGGLWAVFTYVFPHEPPRSVTAGQGSVAAGGAISGSTITIAPPPDAQRR